MLRGGNMANIIITESQLRLISESLNVEMILEEASEDGDRTNILRTVKRLLYAGFATSVILTAVMNLNVSDAIKREAEEIIMSNQPDSTFIQRVNAVKKYMKAAAENQGYNPEDIKLSPEAMVLAADENDFDLPFLLAQAHLESCFGLTPRARKTNSVFSVGCYDNGKNVCKYSTQDDSIVPYINLIKNDYLVDGKTIENLLQKGKFVNAINKRYASDPYYEGKVKNIRNRIVSRFPELI